MDNTQARFLLASFRPDGGDADDPALAEALQLAMENRELGEWLANERAQDAEFARALGSVDLPAGLRADIDACLAAGRGDFPQAQDAEDAAWIGALASLQPPPALRDQVLAAMDRTAAAERVAPNKISYFRRLAVPLAAAAGIALAVWSPWAAKPQASARHQVPIDAVQAGFVRTFESPAFQLDGKSRAQPKLVAHLRERGLPCPGGLPPGLKSADGLGCRELIVDGKRGSLMCFKRSAEGVFHVAILRRDDVRGDFPDMRHPQFGQTDRWKTACWADRHRVYVIFTQADPAALDAVFF